MRYHLPNRLRNHERIGRCPAAQLPHTAAWLRGRELALNIAEHQQGPQGHDHWLDQRRMDSPEEEVCGQRDQTGSAQKLAVVKKISTVRSKTDTAIKNDVISQRRPTGPPIAPVLRMSGI